MGQTIEPIALERGHAIIEKIDPHHGVRSYSGSPADVAIEFSQPESAIANIKTCIDHNIPVVVGTTGWLSKLDEVTQYCKEKDGTVFYASNFSLGVNIFFKVNEYLAELMNNQSDYEVAIDETHHSQKLDAPSGTAISIADILTRKLDRKNKWVMKEAQHPDELAISSHRIDPDAGTHVVTYSSKVDEIEFKHHAHSRQGFAKGAVLVAEWMRNKKGILTMDDFFQF